MKSRFLLPIPILALLIAAGALFLTRGSGPSGGSAEASAQVAAAFVKIQDLKSFTMRQSTVTFSGGDFFEVEQQMTIELPDRGYGTTTVDGRSNEIVILGNRVFTREPTLPWQETTLTALGIDPESLYRTDQQAFLPDELVVLGEVTENGREMIHYHARLDGQDLLDLLDEVFLEDSKIRDVFSRVDIKELEVDYLLGKDDQLPYRATVQMKMKLDGREFKTLSEVEYFDFNLPLELPADLPLTP